ncbi:MAG: DUF1629 domain-containing protein [Hyphomicrobium sp.]|nr:hypothetical protein [Hyphomicrobium sp.]
MEITIEGVSDRLMSSKLNRRAVMPCMVLTDFAVPGLGAAFIREQLDTFWRPFFLLPALTSELITARPEPFLTHELQGKKPPDIFECMDTWLLRENVKQAIEELEPSVHSFLPLRAVTEKTNKYLGIYYAMRIQQVLDAVVVEGSDYQEGPGRLGLEKSKNKRVTTLGTAALDPEKIGHQHLWKQDAAFGAPTFCSDVFRNRIKAIGAKGWKFKACRLGTAKDFENYSW